MYDDDEHLKKSAEIKAKLQGEPYLWKDVWYCIFNNEDTFPHSLAILCRIKCANYDAGVVYVNNFERKTYQEIYYDDVNKLNKIYNISKQKILMRPTLKLGWEGRILNDAKNS